ncbi:MAG: TonB-dependent receptor [Melioribacteraceae bacterium]
MSKQNQSFLTIIFIFFFILISSHRFQTKILEREIAIEIDNLTISEAVKKLDKQLGGIFSYNPDILSTSKTVTLKKKNIKLKKALLIIFESTDVTFTEYNGQIILNTYREKKKVSFSGTVTDASSGEVLIGANIFVVGTNIGASSNQYGFYSITVPTELYNIKCSYIGYKTKVLKNINLQNSRKIDVSLEPESVGLEEVVIESKSKNFNISSVEMGTLEISPKQIKSIPIILGEQDILKSIQLMPGVSTAGEGQSGFFVRGGTADQNLIILDEAPIYNATHLLGFFQFLIQMQLKLQN